MMELPWSGNIFCQVSEISHVSVRMQNASGMDLQRATIYEFVQFSPDRHKIQIPQIPFSQGDSLFLAGGQTVFLLLNV